MPPLSRNARRLVVLIGALHHPTLKRLQVGMGFSLAGLATVLSELQAAGLVDQRSGTYPLTEAGRDQLADLLQQAPPTPRRVLRYRPPATVSA